MTANPIGYVELQTSWLGSDTGNKTQTELSDGDLARRHVEELREKGLRENPGYSQCSARMEETTDGAGVIRYNLYMGFAPAQPLSEPLNPHNLNDAPVQSIGDPARDNNIGWKEQKF